MRAEPEGANSPVSTKNSAVRGEETAPTHTKIKMSKGATTHDTECNFKVYSLSS